MYNIINYINVNDIEQLYIFLITHIINIIIINYYIIHVRLYIYINCMTRRLLSICVRVSEDIVTSSPSVDCEAEIK